MYYVNSFLTQLLPDKAKMSARHLRNALQIAEGHLFYQGGLIMGQGEN